MLTSVGIFWGGEGAGSHWPGADAALLAIVPATLVCALGMVGILRRAGRRAGGTGAAGPGRREAVGA
jgi:uncharacterized membrane protein